MTLATEAGVTELAPRQGPIHRPRPAEAWPPLSEVTLESLKPAHPSAWSAAIEPAGNRPVPWTAPRRRSGAEIGPAPCQAACPAGTDAGRYVGLVAQGRFDEAFAVAAEVNPFPSACGWICTAPCEAACRRGVLDEPISIRTIKRFAAEHGSLPPVTPPAVRRSERVAIVGGGPAGMSAAWYLARLGYGVTVLEAMGVPGGMMAIGIPAYRLPRDVLQAEIARILSAGVELRLNAVMGRDFTLGDLEREGFLAVFLATGASRSRRLGVPGDDVAGVVPATLFLKRVNLGELPTIAGDVVVVGGGSTAMDAARSALRAGAGSVTVAYRRSRRDMPAQVEEIEAAEREGVVIRTGLTVSEVVVRDGLAVALRCKPVAADGAGDPSAGRGASTAAAGAAGGVDLPARTILVAIGEEPDPSILPEGSGIEISAWAGVVADSHTLATGRAGIFAGGDVVSGPKTIIDVELDIAPRPRQHPALPVIDPRSFAPAQGGFEPAMARTEASRCFRCDIVETCTTVHVLGGRGPDDRPAMTAGAHPSTVPPIGDQPTTTGGAA
jgi:NADPH-dependent glutamate synthase beta subunit-like oxidoreductase